MRITIHLMLFFDKILLLTKSRRKSYTVDIIGSTCWPILSSADADRSPIIDFVWSLRTALLRLRSRRNDSRNDLRSERLRVSVDTICSVIAEHIKSQLTVYINNLWKITDLHGSMAPSLYEGRFHQENTIQKNDPKRTLSKYVTAFQQHLQTFLHRLQRVICNKLLLTYLLT